MAGSQFFSKLMGVKDTVQSHVLEVAEIYMNKGEEPGNFQSWGTGGF